MSEATLVANEMEVNMTNTIYNKIKDFKKRFPTTIAWRLKAHSKVAAEHINDDEEVLYAFAAQKLPSVFNVTSTYVIVITDKRILLAQKTFIVWLFLLYNHTRYVQRFNN